MERRISRQQMFIGMARLAAMRATCFRLNVGAIITQNNNPVAIGWNGAPSGHDHCAGNSCPGVVPGHCNTIHAEVNALRKAEGLLEYGSNVDLYCTHSPCADCLEELMKSKLYVRNLFFEFPYRSTQHLGRLNGPYKFRGDPMLPTARVTGVYEVTPAGYVVEYFTRKVVDLG